MNKGEKWRGNYQLKFEEAKGKKKAQKNSGSSKRGFKKNHTVTRNCHLLQSPLCTPYIPTQPSKTFVGMLLAKKTCS